VANHVSYLDIPVLASLSDGVFVAKSEVRHWPLFGFLSRIAQTVFISRRASRIPQERMAIAGVLSRGDSVFMFPEGSSGCGGNVLPFRAGLMSAAQVDPETPVLIQPVSIVYGPAMIDRPALTQLERDCYAWYGAMEMAPHLWRVFGRRDGIAVSVQFHTPRSSNEFSDSRLLTRWAEQSVAAGVHQALQHPFPEQQSHQPVPGDASPVSSDAAPAYGAR